jgi:hypothetical protein
MYIDSLTITALIIFVIALYLFIRFCMVRVYVMKPTPERVPAETSRRGRP